ncbi:unnamed protein product [Blepharisma stoltei]|uniref:Uncharacterized protein n=1 Tax=Blepharisma stoltei TaxID=1481888 RepID=A0AAU9J0M0_9CILI|nr:unnamed protein product [Blepharisma stoltei]
MYMLKNYIYFNKNVYCFGGYGEKNVAFPISMRFDLDKNLWFNIAPMPKADAICHSAIFNENILISGHVNKNILLYSVDLDSFSIIPYDFSECKTKIIINADRLYLIEDRKGHIYESEVGNEYAWNKIANSIIEYTDQMYASYNKGEIYIIISSTMRAWMFLFIFNKGFSNIKKL